MLVLKTIRKPQRFVELLNSLQQEPLRAAGLTTLQVNLGYQCNMACKHCHLSAGPARTERMSPETAERVVDVFLNNPIVTLDLTGGAPELNPSFRNIITKVRSGNKHIISRTNLTVYFEKGMEDLPDFYSRNRVDLIASLPCYLEQNVAACRGDGAYQKSIDAIRMLNERGYGRGGGPSLDLVYNPAGPVLPPLQTLLEADYKRELLNRFGITFNRLYAITNMPIGRFGQSLAASGARESYQALLVDAFNAATIDRLMCRSMINVGWDGTLYDCDFNQALGIPASEATIREFSYADAAGRSITVGDHCYACTAGQGSS
jgi:radical SAM/Cys-rich protein